MADQKVTALDVIKISKITDLLYLVTFDDDGDSISVAMSVEDLLKSVVTGVNRIISGQVIWTGTGFTHRSVQLSYEINGVIYYSDEEDITNSAPDGSNPRFDVIFVDSSGLDIKEGTPAASPTVPSLDNPTSELATNIVLVTNGETTPTGVSLDTMYSENLQESGGEWDSAESTSNIRIFLANTSSPINLTKDIKASSPNGGDTFDLFNTTPIDIADFQNIRHTFKNLANATWKGDYIKVNFYDSATLAGFGLINANSLDTRDTSTLQLVFLNKNQISWVSGETQFDKVEYEFIDGGGGTPVSAARFQVDLILVEYGGITTSSKQNMDAMPNMTNAKAAPISGDNMTLWDSEADQFKQLSWENMQESLYSSEINNIDVDKPNAVNAETPLTTPTYDASGQAIHNSVVYIKQGWNSYKYWMAMTPYTNYDEDVEDPSILASNDGQTWVVPAGLTNPIVPTSVAPDYHADANVILGYDNKLYVYYRLAVGGVITQSQIKVTSSLDGVTWSTAVVCFEDLTKNIVSPSVMKENGTYYMYYADVTVLGARILNRISSLKPNEDWSNASPTACTTNNIPASRYIWHFEVIKYYEEYHMFMIFSNLAVDDTIIYFGKSYDGLDWDFSDNLLLYESSTGGWDDHNVYKGSGVLLNDHKYGFWYCGVDAASPTGDWRTGYTEIYLDDTFAEEVPVACSDEDTALTTGTAKRTFRMPFAMTVSEVRASLVGAGSSSGTTTVDINENGTTILATKLTIDFGEKTSLTAATPAVISYLARTLADDAEMTVDIDAVTGGADETGLKITIIGNKL